MTKLNLVDGRKIFDSNVVAGYSHYQVPVSIVLRDRVRVYYAARNKFNCSETFFVDFDLGLSEVVGHANKPVLELGVKGSFDENGIMPDCAISKGEEIWLYYSGWSAHPLYPHANKIGLAVSTDGGVTFSKIGSGPVMGLETHDPFSVSSGFVTETSAGFKMYYSSGIKWEKSEGIWNVNHDIKVASSRDGIYWDRDFKTLIPLAPNESHARPVIWTQGEKQYLFFCSRQLSSFRDGPGSYGIRFVSRGVEETTWGAPEDPNWTCQLNSKHDCWDSKMRAYPYPLVTPEQNFLLFNGNSFGVTGFGVAEIMTE